MLPVVQERDDLRQLIDDGPILRREKVLCNVCTNLCRERLLSTPPSVFRTGGPPGVTYRRATPLQRPLRSLPPLAAEVVAEATVVVDASAELVHVRLGR